MAASSLSRLARSSGSCPSALSKCRAVTEASQPPGSCAAASGSTVSAKSTALRPRTRTTATRFPFAALDVGYPAAAASTTATASAVSRARAGAMSGRHRAAPSTAASRCTSSVACSHCTSCTARAHAGCAPIAAAAPWTTCSTELASRCPAPSTHPTASSAALGCPCTAARRHARTAAACDQGGVSPRAQTAAAPVHTHQRFVGCGCGGASDPLPRPARNPMRTFSRAQRAAQLGSPAIARRPAAECSSRLRPQIGGPRAATHRGARTHSAQRVDALWHRV